MHDALSLSLSSYMLDLSPWLPAYEFSHLILFLVGLWALLDKESLEAVVSVSLLSFHTALIDLICSLRLCMDVSVHCSGSIHYLTGYHSTGVVFSRPAGCKWRWTR